MICLIALLACALSAMAVNPVELVCPGMPKYSPIVVNCSGVDLEPIGDDLSSKAAPSEFPTYTVIFTNSKGFPPARLECNWLIFAHLEWEDKPCSAFESATCKMVLGDGRIKCDKTPAASTMRPNGPSRGNSSAPPPENTFYYHLFCRWFHRRLDRAGRLSRRGGGLQLGVAVSQIAQSSGAIWTYVVL